MKELQGSVDNRIREAHMMGAKRVSLEKKIDALQQLILQRFQALVAISSIAFAVSGVVISVRGDLIRHSLLAITAAGLFVVIALAGLGRHLFLLRDDIRGISKRIAELPREDWSKPLEEKEFKADLWPETLYGLLILGVILFALSLI